MYTVLAMIKLIKKEAFPSLVYNSCPAEKCGSHHVLFPTICLENLHTVTIDNGQRCIDLAAFSGMMVRSTYFPRKNIHKDVLIDGRFFLDVTNVRIYRGTNIDSAHFLVRVDTEAGVLLRSILHACRMEMRPAVTCSSWKRTWRILAQPQTMMAGAGFA